MTISLIFIYLLIFLLLILHLFIGQIIGSVCLFVHQYVGWWVILIDTVTD